MVAKSLHAARVRPVLQAIARLISTDRRVVVLATEDGEVLLANGPANRRRLDAARLRSDFNWTTLCAQALRSGSVSVSISLDQANLEGELVHLMLGDANGFLLRLVENEQEVTILRNRARTATLMRVSHDLRTPIQSLLATAEVVLNAHRPADQPADNSRERLHRAAEQALQHIDNVLRVIRGELTAAELQADEEFSLTAEAHSILDMIEPIANARGAQITMTQDPKMNIQVYGPVRFVRALMQNMFDNSVKHGGKSIHVHIQCARRHKDQMSKNSNADLAICIEVSDSGGGLPKEQKARLLRAVGQTEAASAAFVDPNKPERGERPSAGINVLAHALRQLNGKLEILDRGPNGEFVTEDGQCEVVGTTLRVWFSLEAASTANASVAVPTPCLSGIRILLVEDSPSSRDWLVHSLCSAGADVRAVENGHKALAFLKQLDPPSQIDILLSDITLPQMSGVELVRRIRDLQANGDLDWDGKIITLTAHVDDRLRSACLELGVVRILEKPIRSAPLCIAVRAAIDAIPTPQSIGDQSDQGAPKSLPPSPPVDLSDRVFNDEVVIALFDQLGVDGTKGFMRRALAEASLAYTDIKSVGVSEDSGRKLHAATGACGLTALKWVEMSLRKMELSIERPTADMQPVLEELGVALAETAKAIENLK